MPQFNDLEIDALPDPMIGLWEMEEYGYTWNEMLPLTQGRALELFDHDLPVYLLHEDGSETTVHDRKQITGHGGIFGIELHWSMIFGMCRELTGSSLCFLILSRAQRLYLWNILQ